MTEWGRWLRFCGVGLGGAIVQTVAVWTLTSWASVDYHAATLVGIATAVTHNFAWHWRWTWADRRRDGRIVQTFLTFATANGLIATLGNLAMMHALVRWLQVAIIPASIASIAVCHLASYGSARRVLGRRRAELGHARQTSAFPVRSARPTS